MAKIDTKPKYVNRSSKNHHDLSHQLKFTCSTGQLLPVFHQFVNAGEKFRGRVYINSRTRPLVTQPFAQVEEQIDWFFVPMSLLYSGFGPQRFQNNDWYSSAISNMSADGMFPLVDITFDDDVDSTNNLYNNPFLDTTLAGTHRLLSHLGYNPNVLLPARANSSFSGYSPKIFPYKALAYQCIYQHYYRNDEYEPFRRQSFNVDNQANQTEAFVEGVEDYTDINNVNGYFLLRYVRRGSDYFTNLHISPILQGVNSLGGLEQTDSPLLKANNYLFNSTIGFRNKINGSQSQVITKPYTSLGQIVELSSGSLDRNLLNTSSIRALFAVDKVLSVTSRAKQTYDDQVLAHFGFKVPTDIKHNVQYFGSDAAKIEFGEVVSNAATDDAPLGEIAGTGKASQGGSNHDFTAPCDGVIMAVYYARPKISYSTVFDKDNAVVNRLDLFVPEFDSLGMQPLYYYESGSENVSNANASNILGWQWRYEQFKRKYDKSITGMRTDYTNQPNQLNQWAISRHPWSNQIVTATGNNGALRFSSFFVTPHDLDEIMVTQYSTTNNSLYATNPATMYARDPIINNLTFDCHLLSIMSDYSMPALHDVG